MTLAGKSREQIAHALARLERDELYDLIFSLVTVEQLLKPSEVASLSGMDKRTVLADIDAGKLGDVFLRTEPQPRVAVSAVNRWRDGFRVRVNGHG